TSSVGTLDLLPAPGARPLPDFQLIEMLGRGGFGEVWRATGPGGIEVALKFIQLGGETGLAELRALELMKNIRHPHLLPLFGAWQCGEQLILAMELAEGTLWDRFQQVSGDGQLGIPPDELLEYMREAAKGIDFLNEYGHPDAEGGAVGI